MFKNKTSKLKYLSNVQTLDELHHTYLAKIDEQKTSLPEKRIKLRFLEQKLDKMDKSREFVSSNDIKVKANLRSEIKSLCEQISNDEGNTDMLDYISRVGDLIMGYYTITNGVYYNTNELTNDTDQHTTSVPSSKTEDPTETDVLKNTHPEQKGIYISDKLKHLNQISQKTRKVKKPVKKRRIIQETSSSRSILNFFPSNEPSVDDTTDINIDDYNQITLNKATLQDKYLMLVDKNYACEKVKIEKVIYCSRCKTEKTLFQSEGCYICKNCGETEHIIMESEMPSHKELSNEKQKYPYKKINHLKEKLNQFQSKESADVPDEICDTVRADLKKRRINCDTCTPLEIRLILKKHKLTSFYEHLQQIYCKISGNVPISLSRETEEMIINMFQAMQESFHIHCPANRSNFLSYSYVLNKLFKILDMTKHAKYFGLLKSKEKLRDQDFIWNKICRDMNWKFYSSF
jgi:Poxvirus Late Transcription Factor VLTF3 like.